MAIVMVSVSFFAGTPLLWHLTIFIQSSDVTCMNCYQIWYDWQKAAIRSKCVSQMIIIAWLWIVLMMNCWNDILQVKLTNPRKILNRATLCLPLEQNNERNQSWFPWVRDKKNEVDTRQSRWITFPSKSRKPRRSFYPMDAFPSLPATL